jgi:hypothetical protein
MVTPTMSRETSEQRLERLHGVLAQIDIEFKGNEAIEQAEELCFKLSRAIIEQAKTSNVKHKNRALTIFHDSYHIHKDKHGSYKGFVNSVDYAKLMSERYLFCYEEAMRYLNKHIEILPTKVKK